MNKYFPKNYKVLLNEKETEKAIKFLKDTFERELSGELKLSRLTSPLFVESGSGINDDLNGVERPVSFKLGQMNEKQMEVVQSLAKWKRMALSDFNYTPGFGIYTDMNAIRADDDIDATHSIYVDQWDWELVIKDDERNLEILKKCVRKIYQALKRTEFLISENFPVLKSELPEDITFIHSEELLELYPDKTPVEREDLIAKEYSAVFIIGIGEKLKDGIEHGKRSPDYDDYSTPTINGYKGLNGDLIVYDKVREKSLELSSMGIRVNKSVLLSQLKNSKKEERAKLYWHSRLLNDEFVQTIGGGIGQSRLCMFLLKKAHIGEVQNSYWPSSVKDEANEKGIRLL